MNRSFTSLRICYFGTLALSLLAVILRTVAMLCCFDATDPSGAELGYFRDGLLPVLCHVLCGLAVLLPLACSLVMPKSDVATLKARMQPAIVTPNMVAIIPAAVSLTVSVLFMILFIAGEPTDKLLLALSLLGALSALFYASRAGLKLGVLISSLLSCAVLAFCCVAIWDMYTDSVTTMNNAVKLSLQFGLVAFMLALTAEARALLDKYAPRSGLFFHALAVFFCFNGSIPNLVAHFSGKVSFNRVHFILASFLLAVAVYETFRFIQLILSYDGNDVQEVTDATAEEATVEAESTATAEEAKEVDEPETTDEPEPETSPIGGDEA